MARIQILPLPPGRDGERPFALIVDQCDPPQRVALAAPPPDFTPATSGLAVLPPVEFTDPWQEFGRQIGATGVIVTQERVEIAGGCEDGSTVQHWHVNHQHPAGDAADRAMVQRVRRRRDGGDAEVSVR